MYQWTEEDARGYAATMKKLIRYYISGTISLCRGRGRRITLYPSTNLAFGCA